MEEQQIVAQFAKKHDLNGETEFRILDLLAEAGEIAADAAKTSEYGEAKQNLKVKQDEIGDTLFSLLLLSSDLGIDAGEALRESIEKYENRIENKGSPGSE